MCPLRVKNCLRMSRHAVGELPAPEGHQASCHFVRCGESRQALSELAINLPPPRRLLNRRL